MDDFNFDHKIKEKLDQYEDPSFDESSLVDFHEKLSSWQTSEPLKVQSNHSYYLAVSLLLFTLINAYLFWPKDALPVTDQSVHIKKQETAIDSLQAIIIQLKEKQGVSVSDGKNKHEQPDTEVAISRDFGYQNPINGRSNKTSIGSINKLPQKLITILEELGLLLTEGDHAYLITPDDSSFYADHKSYTYKISDRGPTISPLVIPQYQLKTIYVNSSSISQKAKKSHISAKMRNELENHYFTGIGINIAPHFDLSKGFFSEGNGAITPRAGILADWILSPRWSIETGVDYSTTKIRLDGDQRRLNVPNYDTSLGEIEHMDIKNSLASIPVAVKYRQWVSEKVQGFIRVGYTPYYLFKTEYKFEHDFDKNYNPSSPKVNSVQENSAHGFYAGTGTFSIGITKRIRNNTKIEGALYYERNISDGQEKLNMQLLGFRSAYWFKLR